MEFTDVLRNRVSVRKFTNEKVDENDLRLLIEQAMLAPSVANSQLWKFIAISNTDLLARMSEMVIAKYDELLEDSKAEMKARILERIKLFSSFFVDSPMVIACISEPYESVIDELAHQTGYSSEEINQFRNHPNIQTMGAAIQTLMLAAENIGYSTCWLTGPMVAKSELEEVLEIHHPDSLIAFVAIGKAAAKPSPKERKPVEEKLRIIR